MRIRKIVLGALLAALCSISAVNVFAAEQAGASKLPWIHASGPSIVDATNRLVVLHGMNLGGWLVEEPWMEPFLTTPTANAPSSDVPIVDHTTLWALAKQRFGTDGMIKLRDAFRDNWITETDFDRMRGDGVNCVRLPFLASLLDEPDGIQWLDRAINWAGARGIYVILDMHGAPGGQSGEAHTGQKGLDQFFKYAANIALAEADWREIALRYRDNPVVAGYDTMNEPSGTPNSDTLYVVQDRLYRAIRSVDTKHIIFIEDGYTGIQWMPFPIPAGWENVAYSTHYYDFNAKNSDDQRSTFDAYLAGIVKERGRRNIPYYVGEFGFEPGGNADTLKYAIDQMNDKSFSWTMWTYKVMWPAGGKSLWALYCNAGSITPLDFYKGSLDKLIRACDELRTERLAVNLNVEGPFRSITQSGNIAQNVTISH
jgi:endoglucanase